MISEILTKDVNSVRRLGIDALTEKLGPVGMLEFMRQFDSGFGDYTKDRRAWLGDLSVEEISSGINDMKQKSGL